MLSDYVQALADALRGEDNARSETCQARHTQERADTALTTLPVCFALPGIGVARRREEMRLDLRAWLEDLGVGQYVDAFAENDVTPDLLASLTAEDLREIGVEKVGHRRRLLNAIAALSEQPEEPATDALPGQPERRQLTILVADIVGSTALATKLDPEDMRALVARFQQSCADAVRDFGGYVGPFLGDAVMAYFGFPRTLENDVESALRAGLAIIDRMRRGLANDLPQVRVAVATGVVVVGRLNDDGTLDENTVIGDTPNLAFRLQGMAEPDTLVCGATTRELAADLFCFAPLGFFEAKGFDDPVELFRVEGESALVSRFVATRTHTIAKLIGRSEEFALLRERWTTAARGEGQAVVVSGASGIGKSRLVRSLIDDVKLAGDRAAVFQCSPLFTESPLYPVVRYLEATAEVAHDDEPSERIDKLRRLLIERGNDPELVDDLAPLLVDPSRLARQMAPDQARTESLRALVRLVLESARRQPLLLVLEDVHWSDPSTLELAQQLLAAFHDYPLMVAITARPSTDLGWTRFADPLMLHLNKLNRTQSAEFLQEIFEDRAISIPVARRIIDRTDGVPLFIEEVCRALLESGALRPDANARLDPDAVLARVPKTLYDTLLTRLDRDPRAKVVAQVAAVIGREFRIELLRALYPGAAAELEAGLRHLLAADLVHPVIDNTPGLLAFKHGLMHQAAYETLLLARRQELHRRIVDLAPSILPQLVRVRPELMARHLSLAGEHRRAAAQWLLAGRHALSRGAYQEATQHLHAGLDAVEGLVAGNDRDALELALQLALAQALRSARFTGGAEALQACRRGRRLAERLGRGQDRLMALRLEFGILFNRPEIDAAALVARAFTEAEGVARLPEAAALGHQATGKVHFFKGEFAQAAASFAAALADRDALPTSDLLTHYQYPVSAMVYWAFTALLQGRTAEADRLAAESLEIARTSSPFTYSLTLANLLLIDLARGGAHERESLRALADMAAARNAPFWVDLVAYHEGWDDVRARRDVASGLRRMRDALGTFCQNAVEIEIPFYEAVLAAALLDEGELDESGALLDDAKARIDRTHERWALVEVLRLRILHRARSGDTSGLDELVGEARAVADAQGAVWWRGKLEETVAEIGLRPLDVATADGGHG